MEGFKLISYDLDNINLLIEISIIQYISSLYNLMGGGGLIQYLMI